MHSPTDTLSHERLSSAEFSTDVILPDIGGDSRQNTGNQVDSNFIIL